MPPREGLWEPVCDRNSISGGQTLVVQCLRLPSWISRRRRRPWRGLLDDQLLSFSLIFRDRRRGTRKPGHPREEGPRHSRQQPRRHICRGWVGTPFTSARVNGGENLGGIRVISAVPTIPGQMCVEAAVCYAWPFLTGMTRLACPAPCDP